MKTSTRNMITRLVLLVVLFCLTAQIAFVSFDSAKAWGGGWHIYTGCGVDVYWQTTDGVQLGYVLNANEAECKDFDGYRYDHYEKISGGNWHRDKYIFYYTKPNEYKFIMTIPSLGITDTIYEWHYAEWTPTIENAPQIYTGYTCYAMEEVEPGVIIYYYE